MNTQIHLRTSSATSTQKMTSEPSPRARACRWLDSLMLHVKRSTKLKNKARGYTGRGYKSRRREATIQHVPETEKCMLAMPRFFHGLLAFLCHKIRDDKSLLRCGQINDRERARIFQSV